jgi:hypothetical protein
VPSTPHITKEPTVKHRSHMIGCAIVAMVVVALAVSGRAPLTAGVGLTLLLCPLLMGTAMWLMMRRPQGSATHDGGATADVEGNSADAARSSLS